MPTKTLLLDNGRGHVTDQSDFWPFVRQVGSTLLHFTVKLQENTKTVDLHPRIGHVDLKCGNGVF